MPKSKDKPQRKRTQAQQVKQRLLNRERFTVIMRKKGSIPKVIVAYKCRACWKSLSGIREGNWSKHMLSIHKLDKNELPFNKVASTLVLKITDLDKGPLV